ncbi:hypothetical protein [uncultured Rubinisphaera sp.]|uniref:hypothetical protein n=1 Tax=uncultured Rubinisphaera sp. TaxID=1678686 RepID=UPI0030DBF50E
MKCVIRQFEINAGRQLLGRESRVGATLVEILMSLLIMGIGLVSVASLFPIAVLRSIQATQLTNAALLNYQCEDYVRAFPGLTRNHYDGTKIIPNIEYTPDSKAWSRIGLDANDTTNTFLPGDGLPDWLEYLALSRPKVVTVVDPIGVLLNSSGDATVYGKDYFNLHTVQDSLFQIDRKNGGFNFGSTIQKNQALSMFSSNDSWSQAYSSIDVTKSSATDLLLNDISAEDISVIQSSLNSNVTVRAVVFDVNGKQSHSSLIDSTSSQTIVLSTAIPNNGMFNVISEVIIETFEPRYSCLITIRRQLMSLGPASLPGEDGEDDDGDGTVDEIDASIMPSELEIGWPGTDDRIRNIGANLVVFFRRDFSPLAEQVYEAGNLRKGLLVGQSTAQPQQVTIRWDSTNEDSKPKLKEGGFVFDVTNGYWYQIRTILIEQRASQNPRNTVNDVEAVILLDQPPQANGNFLMVPENVVEVFDYPGF